MLLINMFAFLNFIILLPTMLQVDSTKDLAQLIDREDKALDTTTIVVLDTFAQVRVDTLASSIDANLSNDSISIPLGLRASDKSAQRAASDKLIEDFFLSQYLRFFDKRYRKSDTAQMHEKAWLLQDSIYVYPNADSVYRARIDDLNKKLVFKLPYNSKVKSYIDVYVNKRRMQVNVMLALSQYYFPIFEDAMQRHGVPKELKYLAVIESALNPRAMSPAGASGLWQFMYHTGKMYDLKIDSKVDERYDPAKASDAAARYLRDLYRSFGDWTLAIAAYNCGPGNVNKAIRRSRGSKDFWTIYPFLPRETRGYVPAYIGATYVMNYYEEHGIMPPDSYFPIITDTLMINSDLDLKHVANTLEIPINILRDLNPQYKYDIIPGDAEYYNLRLPVNFVTEFIENKDSIYYNAPLNPTYNHPSKVDIIYTVKSRETLSGIAQRFNVKVSNIMEWNHLRSTVIYPNQRLKIYASHDKVDAIRQRPIKSNIVSITSQTTAQVNKISESKTVDAKTKQGLDTKGEANGNTLTKEEAKIIYYKVKRGDALYKICGRFSGSNIREVIKMNSLPRNGSLIFPGQVLKIRVKENL